MSEECCVIPVSVSAEIFLAISSKRPTEQFVFNFVPSSCFGVGFGGGVGFITQKKEQNR